MTPTWRAAIVAVMVGTLSVAATACDESASAAQEDAAFLNDMHQNADWSGTSDADLLSNGHATCQGLDGGESFTDLASYLYNANATSQQASAMITYSVTDLCPKYSQQLKAWLQSG